MTPRLNEEYRLFFESGQTMLGSGCKINLSLKITGIRIDGYHTLKSYMIPLAKPFDRMRVSLGGWAGLELNCREADIDPHNNTLNKAYDLLEKKTGSLPGLLIDLEKGVPHGAGLGGGSADAAALLLFLNACLERRHKRLCSLGGWFAKKGTAPLHREELKAVALRVGADVPFFIGNTPAWATGIGEILTPAPLPFAGMHLVLVCPGLKISTPWAFKEWDRLAKMKNFGASTLTRQKAEDTNFSAASSAFRCFNSLEEAVFPSYPELVEIKKNLLIMGARQALMSGSGSSIFGLYAEAEKAAAAGVFFKNSGLRVFTLELNAGASPSW